MGEIKSTLDLVMERTRHLSMSEEEKTQQQRVDFEKRLQGLLQQYADGVLNAEELGDRITQLQAELKASDPRLAVEAVLKRIDPDQDNQPWLVLLENFRPAACAPVREALAAYREHKTDLQHVGRQRMLTQLARRHGIEGPAVVPNPQKDPQYLQQVNTLRHDTQARLEAILQQTSAR